MVRLAATGFILHLSLIALARTVPILTAGPLAGLDRNFLHAVYMTVLLRFSLTTPKPYDLAISIIAMFYGLCILGVFSYFTRVEKLVDHEDE